jgi:S1-C subfamily serine protease
MLAQTPDIAEWLGTPSATLAVARRRGTIVGMGATVRNLVGAGEMSEKGAPTETGVIVETVSPGSAAARAGLKAGDLLLDVNDQAAGSTDRLQALTNSCNPSQPVKLNGLRDQHKVEFVLICRG